MALTPRLELRQSQVLVMTPQLQQAIKLLQLSNLELDSYVEQELERNPLLERAGEERDGPDDADDPQADPAGGAADGDGLPADDDKLQAEDVRDTVVAADDPLARNDDTLDMDYDNLWNNDSPADAATADAAADANPGRDSFGEAAFSEWGTRGGGFDGPLPNLEEVLSGKVSLRDFLTGQLNLELDDPADRLIGVHLIDMLDGAGYVVGELESVAGILGCQVERVEATLARLQQFDPPGIFARDLAECLGLQLRERDRLDPAMEVLLDNLDLVAKHDLARLTRACGVDAEDITAMVAEIRSLDPKPALAYDEIVAQPITPDVLLKPQSGGGWIVELNSATLPRVLVNNRYHARISRQAHSKEDRQYINECYQSANWLVKSLHQRATTILKVASEIVRQQDGFLANGVHYLRPLVLRDIAEVIEMHESTVSRVTSNKYISTPRGIYELKYFFTPAIGSSSGGEAHSAESVRHRIKELIDDEPLAKVLSDDAIVTVLGNEGIDIARRTVAKYREAMSIPSSVQRRREKRHRL